MVSDFSDIIIEWLADRDFHVYSTSFRMEYLTFLNRNTGDFITTGLFHDSVFSFGCHKTDVASGTFVSDYPNPVWRFECPEFFDKLEAVLDDH
jgi:hypothetical protein